MKQQQFSLKARITSFGFAFYGLACFFRREHNAWLHLASTLLVICAALYFRVSLNETVALLIVMGMVWISEIFNTAIEAIMDFISTKQDARIKFIKDVAAAGVLVASFTAVFTGAIIFIPKLL